MPKPRVVLAMIVKDEAPIIEDCLRRVRPFVGCYSIVDTGSSDETPALVHAAMQGIPGVVHHRPWVDFAHNRTECLQLAMAHSDARYALVLDADDEWTPDDGFSWPDLHDDAYEISIVQGDVQWWRLQLLRTDRAWVYTDPVHAIPQLSGATTGRIEGAHIVVQLTGHRHCTEPDKYRRDAEIYEKLLAEGSTDPRHVFYCAQSHRDAGNVTAAMRRYLQRAKMGGWSEEVWYSIFQGALLAEKIGATDQAILSLLAAVEVDHERAEVYVELARIARLAGRHVLAHLAASVASSMRQPPARRLFLDRSAYGWRSQDELAMAAYARGHHQQAYAVGKTALDLAPEHEKARIEANVELSAEKLGVATKPDDDTPRLLFAGAGRSGTGFLAEVMRRAGVEAGHERVYAPTTQRPRWRQVRFEASWLCLPWLPTLPSHVQLVHVVRHPLLNARSWMGVGMFADDPDPGHAQYRRFIERYVPGIIERDTPLERWLAYWVIWNEQIRLYARHERVSIESLDALDGIMLATRAAAVLGVQEDAVLDAYGQVPRDFNSRRRSDVSVADILRLDPRLVQRAADLCTIFGYQLDQDPEKPRRPARRRIAQTNA